MSAFVRFVPFVVPFFFAACLGLGKSKILEQTVDTLITLITLIYVHVYVLEQEIRPCKRVPLRAGILTTTCTAAFRGERLSLPSRL